MIRKSPTTSARTGVTRRSCLGRHRRRRHCSPAPRRSTSCARRARRSRSACCCRARARRPASARTASAASRSRRRSSRTSACPSSQIMNADTETNVEVARARAEKLISDGAQLLVGAFDSGQTTAIAQVAEQKGIPFVINIAAAPPITEQGYKFVFRNFPTAPMILGDAFANQKEVFEATGKAPKSVVFMHVNDTFGTAMQKGIGARDAEVQHALQDRRDDRLRSGRARPLGRGGQGQGDRRRGAADGQPPQRRDPAHARAGQAALDADGRAQHGAGLVRGPVPQDARQARRRPAELRALVRPEQEAEQAARGRARQGAIRASTSTPTTSTRSRRCWSPPTPTSARGSTDPKALADAIRATNITDNVSTGPGIQFDAKGQNDKLKNSAIQNRGGKLVTVAPKAAANAKAEWPMTALRQARLRPAR